MEFMALLAFLIAFLAVVVYRIWRGVRGDQFKTRALHRR